MSYCKLTMVCAECGGHLRETGFSADIQTQMILQVPQCDICRTRAVDAAFNEGQETMKEMIE